MLKEWYNSHPSKELNGRTYSAEHDDNLNRLQVMSLKGELDLRVPVESYSEVYEPRYDKHGKYVSATAVVGTRKRNDLPPIYMQWKEDYRKRYVKEKQS